MNFSRDELLHTFGIYHNNAYPNRGTFLTNKLLYKHQPRFRYHRENTYKRNEEDSDDTGEQPSFFR
jgi:hypothetical protein